MATPLAEVPGDLKAPISRNETLAALTEMVGWLRARPALPLPEHLYTGFGDKWAFRYYATSTAQFRELKGAFDGGIIEADRAFLTIRREFFDGLVSYSVKLSMKRAVETDPDAVLSKVLNGAV